MSRLSLLFATGCLLFAAGCRMHETEVTVQSLMDEEGPTSESWSPIMHISEDGKPRLRLEAGYMARYETADSTYLVMSVLSEDSPRVRVDIFDAAGDSSAIVLSDRIMYFEREQRFVAEGDVVVQSHEDRWIYSEHLAWTERTARIHTPGYATIQTPTQTMSGYGLNADEDLQDFSMKNASGVVIVEDE